MTKLDILKRFLESASDTEDFAFHCKTPEDMFLLSKLLYELGYYYDSEKTYSKDDVQNRWEMKKSKTGMTIGSKNDTDKKKLYTGRINMYINQQRGIIEPEDFFRDADGDGVNDTEIFSPKKEIVEKQPAPTTKICPNCEAELPLNAKFCGNCGHSFIEDNISEEASITKFEQKKEIDESNDKETESQAPKTNVESALSQKDTESAPFSPEKIIKTEVVIDNKSAQTENKQRHSSVLDFINKNAKPTPVSASKIHSEKNKEDNKKVSPKNDDKPTIPAQKQSETTKVDTEKNKKEENKKISGIKPDENIPNTLSFSDTKSPTLCKILNIRPYQKFTVIGTSYFDANKIYRITKNGLREVFVSEDYWIPCNQESELAFLIQNTDKINRWGG